MARHKDDFYPTPPFATEELLDREQFAPHVWECACGDGAISRVLSKKGYRTYDTDLNDYGYGEAKRDFLLEQEVPVTNCDIITNPPFKLANEFVLHALSLNVRKFAFLLRLAFLEGDYRRKAIFQPNPPNRVYVFSKRLTIWRGDQVRKGNGTTPYAWFVWNNMLRKRTVVNWI